MHRFRPIRSTSAPSIRSHPYRRSQTNLRSVLTREEEGGPSQSVHNDLGYSSSSSPESDSFYQPTFTYDAATQIYTIDSQSVSAQALYTARRNGPRDMLALTKRIAPEWSEKELYFCELRDALTCVWDMALLRILSTNPECDLGLLSVSIYPLLFYLC